MKSTLISIVCKVDTYNIIYFYMLFDIISHIATELKKKTFGLRSLKKIQNFFFFSFLKRASVQLCYALLSVRIELRQESAH